MKKFLPGIIILFLFSCTLSENNNQLISEKQIDSVLSKSSFSPIVCNSDFEGVLHHLMYKKSIFSSKWYANKNLPGYEYFLNDKDANNWNEVEKEHIFLMEYWRPPVSQIKNVLFLTAGQQGNLIDRMDPANIVSGQYKDYHHYSDAPWGSINTWKYFKSSPRSIRWKSLAGQIIADGQYNDGRYFGFTPENTCLLIAFDSCNYWDLDPVQKDNLAEDFLEWIFSRVRGYESAIQKVYLAGASMGGALCVSMADKIKTQAPWSRYFSSTKIIVSLMDAVANHEEYEAWTTPGKVGNPLNSSYYGYYSRLPDFIHENQNIHIFQIAGGADVVPVVGAKYHAFYFNQELPSLRFQWVNRDHFAIGREWHDDTVFQQLLWLSTL